MSEISTKNGQLNRPFFYKVTIKSIKLVDAKSYSGFTIRLEPNGNSLTISAIRFCRSKT